MEEAPSLPEAISDPNSHATMIPPELVEVEEHKEDHASSIDHADSCPPAIPRMDDSFSVMDSVNTHTSNNPTGTTGSSSNRLVYVMATETFTSDQDAAMDHAATIYLAAPESNHDDDEDEDDNHVVSVTVQKPTMDSLVGVSLTQKRNVGIVISVIKPDSIFRGTDLRIGMKLLAINDVDCTDPEAVSSHEAAALLRSSVGTVTITAVDLAAAEARDKLRNGGSTSKTAGIVAVTVHKQSKETKVGMKIQERYYKARGTTVPVIGSIDAEGLLAHTALKPQMRILSVNGVSCRGTNDTIAMLKNAEGSLDILAGSIDMVAATVTKSSTNSSPFGINLHQDIDGKLIISDLCGVFAQTDLMVGMQLLRVNGMDVDQLQPADVRAIFDQVQGTVTVIVREVKYKTPLEEPLKETTGSKQHPTNQRETHPSTNASGSRGCPPPGAPAQGHLGTPKNGCPCSIL